MYEKILATISTVAIVGGIIWFICRRGIDRRASDGTGQHVDPVKRDIDRAGENADRAADNNRRATENNRDAQQLVQKAKNILSSAKHTDSDK